MTNKINDMIMYADPILLGFSNKYRRLSNRIYNVIHDMRDISISIGNNHNITSNIKLLDDKLDCLRMYLRESYERDFYHPNETPPLSAHQWEVWNSYNDEIGAFVGSIMGGLSAKNKR